MLKFKGVLVAFCLLLFHSISFASIIEIKDSFECNDRFPHYSFCEAVTFIPWKEEERRQIESALGKIEKLQLSYFTKTLKKSRFSGIYRIKFTAGWYADRATRKTYFFRANDSATLWTDPITGIIGVLESFFYKVNSLKRDLRNEQIVYDFLHELSHAFDITLGDISSSPSFLKVSDWFWDEKLKKFLLNKDQDQIIFKEFLRMVENESKRNWEEVISFDREEGRKYNLPSLYSSVNPQEFFAENAVNFLLKKEEYLTYTDQKLARYFEELFHLDEM